MPSDPWRGLWFDLLRHGEPQGGACFRGSRDDPLTEQGWRQMEAAVSSLTGFSRILSSPLRRCADFARVLAQRGGLECELVQGFAERDFGAWEGLPATRIDTADLARFWADPATFDPPGAEPFADFMARVQGAWRRYRDSLDRHTLLIAHGGVIRAIVAEVLDLPPRAQILFEVPLASCTRLRIPAAPGRASLVWHRGDS